MHDDSTTDFNNPSGGLNPYHPPSITASQEDPAASDQPPRRPIGISILAVLHGLGSLALLGLLVFIAGNRENQEWAQRIGLSWALIVTAGVFSSLLGLASAYGMWTGSKWGWWLSSWYYMSGVVGHTLVLTTLPFQLKRLDEDALEEFLIKHCGRLLINSLFTLYFFRRKVMRYFGLQLLKKWKAAGILVGVTIVLGGALSLFIAVDMIHRRQRAAIGQQTFARHAIQPPMKFIPAK